MGTALRRETLSEQVALQLLDAIRTQHLRPGMLLPSETRLSAEYSVSRQVIREALRSLQGKGVLTIMNGRGAVVRPIDREAFSFAFARAIQIDTHSLFELMEVRLALEVECARLAATRRTTEDLAELHQVTAQMRSHLHDEDAYGALDLAFHLLIARASRNAMLYHLLDSIREASSDAIQVGLRSQRSEEQLHHMQESHEAILYEVERRRPAAAGLIMEQHLAGAAAALAIRVSEEQPVTDQPTAAATAAPEERQRSARRRRDDADYQIRPIPVSEQADQGMKGEARAAGCSSFRP